MPYYPTLAEDLARAKEILERGRVRPEDMPVAMRDVAHVLGGTIYGVDTYAAYKLLESFVAEIERLTELVEAVGPKVCELALRHRQRGTSITCPQCGWTSYNLNDVRQRYCGHCHLFHDEVRLPPEPRT